MSLIQEIQDALKTPLPGQKAQFEMAHAIRQYPLAPPEGVRHASVLLLLFPKKGQWHTVFIQRVVTHKADRHSGQISFPGGKHEETDQNMKQTALREAEEEVGIQANDVEVLGRLTELYIPVSNFLVHPFIGHLPYTPSFIPQLSEVADILESPVQLLTQADIRKVTDMRLPTNITLKRVPYFDVRGHIVWGATAMMLSEFLNLPPLQNTPLVSEKLK